MAGVRDEELIAMPGWPAGINNLARETAVPGGALRDAVNFDLDRAGKPRVRPGRTRAYAGNGVHSAWSHDYLPWGLIVDDDRLCVFHSDHRVEPLIHGLARGLPVSYCLLHDAVAWSNGVQCGQITRDLEARPWACPTPEGRPEVSVLPDGALDAGLYQIAVTWVDAAGRESGATPPVAVDVPAGSALALTAIPQPADPVETPRVRIYASAGNDGVLRLATTLPAGLAATTLLHRPSGRPLETLHLRALPPGQIVRQFAGRQLVARGHALLYSAALRYGLFDPRYDWVDFAERIDMLEPLGDGTDLAGIFVADRAKTYWLSGANPADWRPRVAYPVGAVPGTAAVTPGNVWGLQSGDPVVVWLARNGHLCLGLPGGAVSALKLGEAVIDAAERGALLFREQAGLSQAIVALKGAHPQTAGVRDRMVVREYRHTT